MKYTTKRKFNFLPLVIFNKIMKITNGSKKYWKGKKDKVVKELELRVIFYSIIELLESGIEAGLWESSPIFTIQQHQTPRYLFLQLSKEFEEESKIINLVDYTLANKLNHDKLFVEVDYGFLITKAIENNLDINSSLQEFLTYNALHREMIKH